MPPGIEATLKASIEAAYLAIVVRGKNEAEFTSLTPRQTLTQSARFLTDELDGVCSLAQSGNVGQVWDGDGANVDGLTIENVGFDGIKLSGIGSTGLRVNNFSGNGVNVMGSSRVAAIYAENTGSGSAIVGKTSSGGNAILGIADDVSSC